MESSVPVIPIRGAAPTPVPPTSRGIATTAVLVLVWAIAVPLFGIDKVTKYHMDAPLYVTSFVWVMNKARYEGMSAAQKKVIDDHCTNEWAVKSASPWADFEHAGIAKLKGRPGARGLHDHVGAA